MKRLVALAVFLVAGAVAAGVAFADHGGRGHGGKHHGGKVVYVIEHVSTDAVTNNDGRATDSVGDILTFANEVFDAADATKVGTDNGYCLRTVTGAGAAYECNWTTFLDGGQITVEGPFFDAKDSTLAITGGTGRFRGARGEMELHSRDNGAKFAFVFHLKG